MIKSDLPGSSATELFSFKQAVFAARYDATANAIIHTMKTPQQASEFAGTTVPVQGRLFTLKRFRDDSIPDAAVAADLNAYELQVWNMGGQLDALNVWHVFHGLLGLKVTYLENAPARQNGPVDSTL